MRLSARIRVDESEKMKAKIKIFAMLTICLVGSIAVSMYFEVKCDSQLRTRTIKIIRRPLQVIEGTIWIFTAVSLLCYVFLAINWFKIGAGVAMQLFFVLLIIAFATDTFYRNADRYYSMTANLNFKMLPENDAEGGRLADDYLDSEIRRRGVEFYDFLDEYQRDNQCCGMKNYTEWLDQTNQEFLHVDYTNSCTPYRPDGKPERPVTPSGVPKYCRMIFSDESQRIPASCCLNEGNMTCLKGSFSNESNIAGEYVYTKGCGKLIREEFNKCYPAPIVPCAAAIFLFLGLYITMYAFIRDSEKVSFWTGCLSFSPKKKGKAVPPPKVGEAVALAQVIEEAIPRSQVEEAIQASTKIESSESYSCCCGVSPQI